MASSYLAAFVVCGGKIIYNTSAPRILIITNSHQNMALILQSVCKFKYDIILGRDFFSLAPGKQSDISIACVCSKRKETFQSALPDQQQEAKLQAARRV